MLFFFHIWRHDGRTSDLLLHLLGGVYPVLEGNHSERQPIRASDLQGSHKHHRGPVMSSSAITEHKSCSGSGRVYI